MKHSTLWLAALPIALSGMVFSFACGGKVVVDAASGAGGDGGGGTTVTTTTVTSTTVTSTSVTTTVTSTSSGMTCTSQSCIDALSNGTAGTLCNPSSEKAYSLLLACVCANKCQVACAANVCIHAALTPPCKACIGDPQNGCGTPLDDCSNN